VSHAITRLYSTAAQATAVVAALKQKKFTDDLITVVHPTTPAAATDAIVAAITAGYVLKADARVYAQGVQRGLSLVSVLAPFGSGGKVLRILDAFSPVESGVRHGDPAPLWDEYSPFSSALRLPVLLKGNAVFSSFWSLPVLSRKSWTVSSALHIPAVSSGSIGASRFGIPLLLKSRPYQSRGTARGLKAAAR
jgi:hypothetical protein